MAINRALYVTFYFLYLLTLAIGLWFLIYYGQVPNWVWILFAVAILILFIGVIVKEFLLTRQLTIKGIEIPSTQITTFLILYMVAHLLAFMLIIAGIVLVIIYSVIPWWVWVILGLGIIITIIAPIILAFEINSELIAFIVYCIGFILLITGFILVIIYSEAPWWVWIIIALALIFSMIANVLEYMSEKNTEIVTRSKDLIKGMVNQNPKPIETKSLRYDECGNIVGYIEEIKPIEEKNNYALCNLLPNYNLPEQSV